jgi:hypothetical protein
MSQMFSLTRKLRPAAQWIPTFGGMTPLTGRFGKFSRKILSLSFFYFYDNSSADFLIIFLCCADCAQWQGSSWQAPTIPLPPRAPQTGRKMTPNYGSFGDQVGSVPFSPSGNAMS